MPQERMKNHRLLTLLIIVVLSGTMTFLEFFGFLSPLDHIVYDTLMNHSPYSRYIRNTRTGRDDLLDQNVVLITIDQASETKLGMRISGFNRSMLAHAIDALSSAGAAVIGIDLDLSKHTDPGDDSSLAEAIKKSGRVVLAGYVAHGRLVQPLGSFLSNALGEGLINLHIDRDGVLRSTYVVVQSGSSYYLTFPLSVAARSINPGEPVISVDKQGVTINGTRTPVHDGSMFINYAAAPRYKSISYYKVFDGSFNPGEIRGKIVLIGNTSPLYHDYYDVPLKSTSGRKTLSGIQIYGYAIATFLDKHFILFDGGVWTAVLTACLIVAAGILLLVIKKPYFMFFGIIVAAGMFQWLMFSRGLFVPLSGVYISIPLLAFYAIDHNYMTEYRAHRYVAKAFEHYVSKELLHEMRRNPGMLKLGGEKKEITVLFSDIRNFTSLSESVSPEKLVEFLHLFFNTMTEIIYRHHGVVDKFIGDAIMAIFGAPVPDKHHADHAVAAGMDMSSAMDDLKKQAARITGSEIAIGIGINTGKAIVGNMGSDKRFDYTAIGDTVNLASRLEGLNRFFGSTCIISDMTKKNLDRQVPVRQIGVVKVKGKTEGVMLYEVMTGDQTVVLKYFHDIWRALNNDNLVQARTLLKHLLDQRPDDRICSMLSFKVEQALSLGAVFDPVIEMQEK